MKRLYIYLIVIGVVVSLQSQAFALIRVVSVKGRVAYKEGASWKGLAPGRTLRPGTKISTGVRSRAVLQVDNHRVIIRPLTMMKIYENRRRKGVERTRLGLRRGGIRAKITRSKRIRTSFKISTPVATSSVRGTDEGVSYGPGRGMIIRVYQGLIEGENNLGAKRLISGRQRFKQRPGQPAPGGILSDVQAGTFIRIYSNFLTPEELQSLGFFGSDIPYSFDDALSLIDSKGKTPALLTITIQWPG